MITITCNKCGKETVDSYSLWRMGNDKPNVYGENQKIFEVELCGPCLCEISALLKAKRVPYVKDAEGP